MPSPSGWRTPRFFHYSCYRLFENDCRIDVVQIFMLFEYVKSAIICSVFLLKVSFFFCIDENRNGEKSLAEKFVRDYRSRLSEPSHT